MSSRKHLLVLALGFLGVVSKGYGMESKFFEFSFQEGQKFSNEEIEDVLGKAKEFFLKYEAFEKEKNNYLLALETMPKNRSASGLPPIKQSQEINSSITKLKSYGTQSVAQKAPEIKKQNTVVIPSLEPQQMQDNSVPKTPRGSVSDAPSEMTIKIVYTPCARDLGIFLEDFINKPTKEREDILAKYKNLKQEIQDQTLPIDIKDYFNMSAEERNAFKKSVLDERQSLKEEALQAQQIKNSPMKASTNSVKSEDQQQYSPSNDQIVNKDDSQQKEQINGTESQQKAPEENLQEYVNKILIQLQAFPEKDTKTIKNILNNLLLKKDLKDIERIKSEAEKKLADLQAKANKAGGNFVNYGKK